MFNYDDNDEAYVESRGGIDQVQCYECGRNILIYCDDPRKADEIICPRCKARQDCLLSGSIRIAHLRKTQVR